LVYGCTVPVPSGISTVIKKKIIPRETSFINFKINKQIIYNNRLDSLKKGKEISFLNRPNQEPDLLVFFNETDLNRQDIKSYIDSTKTPFIVFSPTNLYFRGYQVNNEGIDSKRDCIFFSVLNAVLDKKPTK